MSELEPRFDKDGQYVLRTRRDRLAAAYATLRSIVTIPQAYYGLSPGEIADQMRQVATKTLQALAAASPDGWHRSDP